jgi:hypothetical protein
MSKELTIILKDTERTYRQKFLVYEDIQLIPEDPTIVSCIEQARKNFNGEPEDIQIRVLLVVR